MSVLILNLAYLALVSSTFFRRVLWLRAMLVAGAIGFVAYGAINGITSMVVWNIIIGVLHGRQLLRFVLARRAVELSEEDERLRVALFPRLDRFDFHSLWSMGIDDEFVDVRLTVAGQPSHAVYLILDGIVEVRAGEAVVAELGPGALVGEISFVADGVASADTFTIGRVRVREWDQTRLATLDQLNPTAARALQLYIGQDLAKKLL